MGVPPTPPREKTASPPATAMERPAKKPSATSRLRDLVVDAGAIIKGVPLANLADNLWTVEEVVQEIKDRRARELLESLPVELRTREPSTEAMRFIAQFAAHQEIPPKDDSTIKSSSSDNYGITAMPRPILIILL